MRRDRDWSQQQGFEALREGLHFGPKSRASYSAIDMGKRAPTPTEQEFLVRYFGKSPDDVPEAEEPTERPDALVEALTRQAAATERLVGLLEPLTVEPALSLAMRLEELEAVVGRLVEREFGGSPGRSVPRVSGG